MGFALARWRCLRPSPPDEGNAESRSLEGVITLTNDAATAATSDNVVAVTNFVDYYAENLHEIIGQFRI